MARRDHRSRDRFPIAPFIDDPLAFACVHGASFDGAQSASKHGSTPPVLDETS